MTLARNTAEGLTAGTNLTAGNSGDASGDAFYLVSPSNTTALTFSSTQAKRGAQSYKLNSPAGTAVFAGLQRTANDALTTAVDFYLTGYPTTSNTNIIQLRTATAPAVTLQLRTDGKTIIQDTAGTTLGTSATTLPLNTWLHVDIRAVKGTGTTDGTIAWNVTNAGTSIFSGNITGNAGTAQYTELRFGKLTAAATLQDTYLDDITADDGNTNLLGPAPTTGAPTANAGGAKTATVGTPIQLTGTGTGTGLTYTWNVQAADGGATATITNQNTATPTVTPTGSGVLYIRLTVTSSNTLTATDTAIIYVPAATATPISGVANIGGWTAVGSDVITALSDNSNSTYTQSPDNPASPATQRVRLAPLQTGTGFNLKIDHQITAAGAGTATITLYEGNINRKTWTLTPSTTITTTTLTLTDAEYAAIGNTNILDVEMSWNIT